MTRDTDEFLRVLNAQNDRLAAMKTEEQAPVHGVDEMRLQRNQERREKWGKLRARPRPSRRPRRARSRWDTVDINV